jgi:hypothetical protein
MASSQVIVSVAVMTVFSVTPFLMRDFADESSSNGVPTVFRVDDGQWKRFTSPLMLSGTAGWAPNSTSEGGKDG